MKTVMIIPTFNERKNIKEVIKELLKLNIKKFHLLIVDDSSPDGTAEVVKELMKQHKNIRLLQRPKGMGRGSACIDGYKKALAMGAEIIGEMDADHSHQPEQLPRLWEGIKHADLVLGSRLVKGGGDKRVFSRRLLTKLACFYTRHLLGLKVRDCNSGYRLFRRKVLEKLDLDTMIATHHNHVQEILYKVHLAGFSIKEVPITFAERLEGKSKVTGKHIVKGLSTVLKLRWMHLKGKF